ncbi:hypothetical protein FKM82_011444 [Ascaphus truei]
MVDRYCIRGYVRVYTAFVVTCGIWTIWCLETAFMVIGGLKGYGVYTAFMVTCWVPNIRFIYHMRGYMTGLDYMVHILHAWLRAVAWSIWCVYILPLGVMCCFGPALHATSRTMWGIRVLYCMQRYNACVG